MSCSHPSVWNGLCVDCGQEPASLAVYDSASFVSLDVSFRTKRARLVDLELENFQEIVKRKKAVLVFDLDHTLLHVTMRPLPEEITTNYAVYDLNSVTNGDRAISDTEIYSFDLNGVRFHLKLRPHLIRFLTTLRTDFEFYVYTHGTTAYAQKLISAIDPDGRLFSGRILSRTSNQVEAKQLKKIFPTEHRLVVILDDRNDVWADGEDNLFRVSPYFFFPDPDRQSLGLEGLVKLKEPWKFDLCDRQLDILLPLLQSLHLQAYLLSPPDIRTPLLDLRKGVLQGKQILTSGLIPTDIEDPWSHPVAVTIRDLGGVEPLLEEEADLVIAANLETKKVKDALKRGCKILHFNFILQSQAILRMPEIDAFELREGEDQEYSHWSRYKEADDAEDALLADLLA